MKANICILILGTLAAHASAQTQQLDRSDRILHQASDLMPWCEAEARYRYMLQGVSTFQWSGSYHDRSNMLFVEGHLRAGGEDVAVHCRAVSGARTQDAVIEIDAQPG
ncbi:hypothetical protein [Xanthomonas bonasiae]|uniref:hypothetical protein n=1 Tax=Xanthomonas bonasiae TaxID=2810351 RepID=UPI0017842741|nr:hypothetical protein [Xanthomonas surreyensis]MBD7923327.1 hypothetical protein [Xanthomonas surreyensis]